MIGIQASLRRCIGLPSQNLFNIEAKILAEIYLIAISVTWKQGVMLKVLHSS